MKRVLIILISCVLVSSSAFTQATLKLSSEEKVHLFIEKLRAALTAPSGDLLSEVVSGDFSLSGETQLDVTVDDLVDSLITMAYSHAQETDRPADLRAGGFWDLQIEIDSVIDAASDTCMVVSEFSLLSSPDREIAIDTLVLVNGTYGWRLKSCRDGFLMLLETGGGK